jgi:hypothetical protein
MAFKRLDPEDFVVSADSITAPAWTNNVSSLTALYTSSVQEASSNGNYYLNVYQTASTNTSAEVQFNIAYGNSTGLGSLLYNTGIANLSPTRTVYGQFRNLIYGDENASFIFGGVTQDDFYVITLDRARFKQTLFPGSLNLRLYNSSNNIIQLTDNSNDVSVETFLDCGRVYQIVSGSSGYAVSLANSAPNAVAAGMTISGSYGLMLPDIGTIILNAAALDLAIANGGVSLGTTKDPDTDNNNPARLFARLSTTAGVSSFALNSQETVTSDFAFVRARNGEFNYSENPSFISGSTGTIVYDAFIQNPQTYITTIGLYNDNNELLGVAKLSKPLKKDFSKEALIRVKLDF